MSEQPDSVATWVARLNRLAREMDEVAVSIHPSSWHEMLAPLREEYRRLAVGGLTKRALEGQ